MSAERACEHSPLPADFICPACGYDLSGAAVERCSECGAKIDEVTTRADWRRRRFMRWAPFVVGGGWGLALISIVAYALQRRAEPGEIVLALLLLLGPGLLGGFIVTFRLPQSQIGAAWHAWLLWLPLAILPIVGGFLTGLLFIFLGVERIDSQLTFFILATWMAIVLAVNRRVWYVIARLAGIAGDLNKRRSIRISRIVAMVPAMYLVALFLAYTLRSYL